MANPTPGQVALRDRIEGAIALAAPLLDGVLTVGERSPSRRPEDEYYPVRPAGEAFELARRQRTVLNADVEAERAAKRTGDSDDEPERDRRTRGALGHAGLRSGRAGGFLSVPDLHPLTQRRRCSPRPAGRCPRSSASTTPTPVCSSSTASRPARDVRLRRRRHLPVRAAQARSPRVTGGLFGLAILGPLLYGLQFVIGGFGRSPRRTRLRLPVSRESAMSSPSANR